VSGGSVIGGLYAASDDDSFPAFEARVRAALARGLAGPTIRTAFLTTEGAKALLCFALVGTTNLLFAALTWVLRIGLRLFPVGSPPRWRMENWHLPFRRFEVAPGNWTGG
jgi:NTE family protein